MCWSRRVRLLSECSSYFSLFLLLFALWQLAVALGFGNMWSRKRMSLLEVLLLYTAINSKSHEILISSDISLFTTWAKWFLIVSTLILIGLNKMILYHHHKQTNKLKNSTPTTPSSNSHFNTYPIYPINRMVE